MCCFHYESVLFSLRSCAVLMYNSRTFNDFETSEYRR
nr:MAG TPA: hypothetical protein [Bacteriophage sp.]DAR58933.1 MAG TPA: hypothetical protein [Caudoviricetes sp.]